MTLGFRRPRAWKRPVPAAAAMAVALAAGLLAAGAPAVEAAPERVAATGGCRAVGSGDAPSGGGPNRATVVVDTGSGPVWSACISFSGTISGVEALERAESVITDLDPVYDQYTGLGKAVCKLRSVGTNPPDCLGKSVNYWSLSLNGRVTPVGAGGLTIRDGDVEGWRYGTGGTPRGATAGTEAAAAPPVTTTRPPTPTTQPTGGTTTPPGGGGQTGSTKPDSTPSDPTTTRPGSASTTRPGSASTTTAPGATTTTKLGQTTTTAAGRESGDDDDPSAVAAASDDGGSDDESAAGGTAAVGSTADGDGGSESSLPAVLGFVAVIAAVGGGALLVRRRRAAPVTPIGPA